MKKSILITLLILTSFVAKAFDFEVDGVGYSVTSISNKTVCVSGFTSGGDIVIPDKVMYNNYLFTVDSLANLFDARRTSSIRINSLIKTNGYNLYACNTACFYVDESNPYMKAVDGVLYSKDLTRLICFPPYKYVEDFVIPNHVNRIDDYSFGANKYITRLFFNNIIEELPECFLYGGGDRLVYLKLSDKIKVIHGRCLYWHNGIKEIVLPKELEEVEKDRDWMYYGLSTSYTDITIYNSRIANYVYKLQPSLYVFSRFKNLKNFHVSDSNPIELDENIFTDGQYFTINLYVPTGTKEVYQCTKGWKNFFNIIEEDFQPSEQPKCANPSITYLNGKLWFESETDGVTFVSTITCDDYKNYNTAVVPLTAIYRISVYATKDGYDDSDIVTKEISIRGLKGDVNEDGEISIADINTTIGIILGE